MSKVIFLYFVSGLFFLIGGVLIRNGINIWRLKKDFKSQIRTTHYIPIKNMGAGFRISLGVLCLILASMLLFAL